MRLGANEDEKRKLQEIARERQPRLERQKTKQEKSKNMKEMDSKEEIFKRRIMLAEIKENVWKRRGAKSIHEEHSDRLENEKKTVEVRERIEKLEEMKKTAEENEIERRKEFMVTGRKRKRDKKLFRRAGKCGKVGGVAGRINEL